MDDFEQRSITVDDVERIVYTAGSGPAVIVMSEMPGISPDVIRFARWVRDAGFTAYLPSLFGRDGAVPTAEEGTAVFRRACVSAEFRAFGAGVASPVTDWLRGLARVAASECGDRVGAIGMCFTGNFALTMMLEPVMQAAVLSQPSLPLDDPAGLEIAPDQLSTIRSRLDREDLTVRGYRFDGDRWCTAARFAAYDAALGARFVATVLPDEAAHQDPPPFFAEVVGCAHSVVTAHLRDEEGSLTLAARDEILTYFTNQLSPR